MSKRFAAIWFRYLRTDWFTRRQPELKNIPFALVANDRGRRMITAANEKAQMQYIEPGMTLADARTICPGLVIRDDDPEKAKNALTGLAGFCIRFTPSVAIDPPKGLILDVTGCAHLWGNERNYLEDISKRLLETGYDNRVALADTIGAARAVVHFGEPFSAVPPGRQKEALLPLPPAALQLERDTVLKLEKLGLGKIGQFINMPRSSLRRRFGQQLLLRLDQALGYAEEEFNPVQPLNPYQERLPCMEPILTAKGIEIALQHLLEILCHRLVLEEKGLRSARFSGYRMDGRIETIEIGTNRPSHNRHHLFKLFEIKIETMEPDLGIELFVLEAPNVEDLPAAQEKLWETFTGTDNSRLAELLDRLAIKTGASNIRRFLPAEHHWPERSFKLAVAYNEKTESSWKIDRPRPLLLLPVPVSIEVTAPIPDYPPMLFRYLGTRHKIIKADGPERIESEWWLQPGQHRDYYRVEDTNGCRYWLFRAGHYDETRSHQWFMHGFFA